MEKYGRLAGNDPVLAPPAHILPPEIFLFTTTFGEEEVGPTGKKSTRVVLVMSGFINGYNSWSESITGGFEYLEYYDWVDFVGYSLGV